MSLRDVGERLGIEVKSYDYSEPAYGKVVCDRMLCPMKSSICDYCYEGHDIACAADIHAALRERRARGVTASVCVIDDKKKSLRVKKKLTDLATSITSHMKKQVFAFGERTA